MSELGRIELDSITEFQKKLNTATDANSEVFSSYSGTFTRGQWNSAFTEELRRSNDNEDEFTYSINETRDILEYSYATWPSPNMRVREPFRDDTRICWPKNLCTNRFIDCKFYSADLLVHEFDGVWIDAYYQAFMKNKEGARDAHNLNIGNIPALTEWSTELPETSMEFDLPWFYSEHPALAYPLYKLHQSKAKSFHTFKMRNSVWQFLRMCIKDEKGEWQTVSAIDYRDRLEPFNERLPYPKIWGRYAMLTAAEKACLNVGSISYIIRNVIPVNTDNKFNLGTTQTVSLATIAAPCLGIFWMTENVTASQSNCLSNYTTHESVDERGYARNPIETVTLKYTKDPKGSSGVHTTCFKDFETVHFTSTSYRRHLPSCTTEIGYHCYTFGQDLGGYLHGERAISLAAVGAEFSCKYWKPRARTGQKRIMDSSKDLEASISDSVSVNGSTGSDGMDQHRADELMNNEFILHTRILIMRELMFEQLPDGKTVLRLN